MPTKISWSGTAKKRAPERFPARLTAEPWAVTDCAMRFSCPDPAIRRTGLGRAADMPTLNSHTVCRRAQGHGRAGTRQLPAATPGCGWRCPARHLKVHGTIYLLRRAYVHVVSRTPQDFGYPIRDLRGGPFLLG